MLVKWTTREDVCAAEQDRINAMEQGGRGKVMALRRNAAVRFVVVALCLGRLCSCCALKQRSRDVAYTPSGSTYSTAAYQIGRTDAERDIRMDRLMIEFYGFPPEGYDRYVKILEKRYNIKVRVIGDILDGDLVGHTMGYNEVSKAEIKRRFGDNVLSEAAAASGPR